MKQSPERRQIGLIHWHAAEAAERVRHLDRLGYEARVHCDHERGTSAASAKALLTDELAAVVIDLARLPGHGRAMAIWLREHKATRRLPLVVIEGDAAKTARMRADLPDASYTNWTRIGPVLKKAIANPLKDPVVPGRADYSGTPLPKKLGIKPGSRVALVQAPKDFASTLGDLPAGVAMTTRLTGELDVVVMFCRAVADLRAVFATAAACLATSGGLWVAWPKKASGVLTELDDGRVRAFGLDQGLVDNKVCAIDATWSGLRFARRRTR